MPAFKPIFLTTALLCSTALVAQRPAPPQGSPQAPVPIASLVAQVDIPHQDFTLPNGLRVIVHTDRKAPIVAVSVWYHIGSKDEPVGKSGYAHLFEHLMFNGSENAPGDFFEPLQQVGATDYNGTTSFDRTNYFETVPTPALERALFLESDRMGHLLGAINQTNLKNQIAVVQNEKRSGDNQPFGLVDDVQQEALFPVDHPYHHTTIGSMADLTRASLDDVKGWFRANYGPNNAVLVLAGDVDVATAKRLVTRYFGDIPRGAEVTPTAATVPTLPVPKAIMLHDRVATTRLYRTWAVPGLTDRDSVPLDVAAAVLGGLSSSRLDNALVRSEKLAVSVSAYNQSFERVGEFSVTVDVRPGVDVALVNRRLDAIIADLVKNGPTADEVQRVAMREVAGRIGGLESVGGFGGKAVALAEGAVYAGDPDLYKKQLATMAAVTPQQVQAVAQRWLSRPALSVTVAPGERGAYDEAGSASGGAASAPAATAAAEAPAGPAKIGRGGLPAVGQIADLDFPIIRRTTLSNGIAVIYAHRAAVPLTRVSVSFDAGNAADPHRRLGTEAMMLALLDEGTATRTSVQIAEAQERLGASIGAGASMDRTTIGLSALTANLAPSLDLLQDVIRHPAFAPAEVDRIRNQQLAAISSELTQPQGIAYRALPPLLYGPDHPYGIPFSGSGDSKVVATLTRDELTAFHARWIRPDNARIFVVSSASLEVVVPLLEANFGSWRVPAVAKGVKDLGAATPPARARIVLIDRPQSPQSYILGAQLLPLTGRQPLERLGLANDVLGGTFLSRLNMDLRETRGWSYGVNGGISRLLGTVPYLLSAPVQSNQTGASIVALRQDMTDFLTRRGLTPPELERAVNNRTRGLAGNFEGADDVLGALQAIDLYGWKDDYYRTLAARYRAATIPQLDAEMRAAIDPARFLWVVVGDAKLVRPQLAQTGLPVETMAVGP